MAEISREEVINELDVMGGNCSTDYDFIVCHKAISDMEKLKKIEQILKHGDNKCVKCDPECEHFHFDERYCEIIHRYDLIEQIIKGE